jgi:serine/threonine-protein kinase haspin
MLGTRTKQVNAYGKRGHRIVNVSDIREAPVVASHAMAAKPNAESSSPLRESAETSKSPPRRPRVNANVARSPLSSPEHTAKAYHRKPTSFKTQSSPQSPKQDLHPERSRKPLSNVSMNVKSMRQADEMTSPNGAAKKKRKQAAVYKGTPPRAKMSVLKPASPVVNVEITVLDDCGEAVKQERRMSKPDVQTNPVSYKEKKPVGRLKASGKSKREVIILSDDSEDDDYVPPVRARNIPSSSKGRRVILTSDDDSEVEILDPPRMRALLSSPEVSPLPPRPVKNKGKVVTSSSKLSHGECSNKYAKPSMHATRPSHKAHPAICMPQQNAIHFSPLVRPDARKTARQLTPRRPHPVRSVFPAPPSPPSPTTLSDEDENLSFDLSQLALSPKTLGQVTDSLRTTDTVHGKPQPLYLKPLLEACSQTEPHEFSAFIEMFPLDPIVRTSHGSVELGFHPAKAKSAKTNAQFQKIGEASFSEVFGIGDVVLKVIPLRDEDAKVLVVDDDDTPAPSDVKDVLREIIVTRAMGEMCEGFVQLLRTYVVRGKYPSLLLDLWDEYDDQKGSESVRPGQ